MIRRVALLATLVLGCGAARFPSEARDCELTIRGLGVGAARCIQADHARATAIRVDAAGDIVLAGTFVGRLPLDPAAPILSSGDPGQAFVARLSPDLTLRFVRPVDAPGVLRGVAATPHGVVLVTSSGELPEGPFLTRLDANGRAALRRDLGFGGLVTGVSTDARGTLALRVQQDGIRVVVVSDEDGRILGTQRFAPPWAHLFPASVTADALVGDLALASGAIYALHARAPDYDGDQAMTKVLASGAVAWTRPVPVGTNAQLVAIAGGLAALTPDATALCPGPLGTTFAVTAFDGEGAATWQRCFDAHAAELRLAADPSGRAVVTGQMDGHADLGGGAWDVPSPGLASFVLLLDERGGTRRAALLTGPTVSAIQAVAVTPGGDLIVAGAVAVAARQSHFFIASLHE